MFVCVCVCVFVCVCMLKISIKQCRKLVNAMIRLAPHWHAVKWADIIAMAISTIILGICIYKVY